MGLSRHGRVLHRSLSQQGRAKGRGDGGAGFDVDCSGVTQGKWDFQVPCQSGHLMTIGFM